MDSHEECKRSEDLACIDRSKQTTHYFTCVDGFEDTAETPLMMMDMEKVKLVVSEQLSDPAKASDYLLGFNLRIDPAAIELGAHTRLSRGDPVHVNEWSLVHSGYWLGCKVAVKVFKFGMIGWNKEQLLEEVGPLMELRHPHVTRVFGVAQDAEGFSILMELMDTFLPFLRKSRLGRPFTRSEELDIITQIAKGMYYLHTQQYVHGQLKCSSILVNQIGDHLEVKISELRSSQKLGKPWDPEAFKNAIRMRRPRWTAPEAIKIYGGVEPSEALLKKSDVYSFGMTCYEVVTGKIPFEKQQGDKLLEQVEKGIRPELPKELNDDLRGLIQSCWDSDPNKRPTFENICHVLDNIKSSKSVATGESSRPKDKMLGHPEKILKPIQGVFTGLRRLVPGNDRPIYAPTTSTWGKMDESGMVQGESASGNSGIIIPENLRIDHINLKKVRRIGSGAFAKVYEATWLGCTFAVKRFKPGSPSKTLQKELDLLIKLNHPHIVRLVGFSVDSQEQCSIVMEFMRGNLRELINSWKQKRSRVAETENIDSSQPTLIGPFDLNEAVGIIERIALGMRYLHSMGVMHRDLKSSNVLAEEHTNGIEIKIADFGVSQQASEALVDHVGTGFWRAPEILAPPVTNIVEDKAKICIDLKAADVYSYAMTCYEVFTGRIPFEEQLQQKSYKEVTAAVISGELRPVLPADLNSDLKVLIEECWHREAKKRPTFTDICKELQRIQQSQPSSSLLPVP